MQKSERGGLGDFSGWRMWASYGEEKARMGLKKWKLLEGISRRDCNRLGPLRKVQGPEPDPGEGMDLLMRRNQGVRDQQLPSFMTLYRLSAEGVA